MIVTPRRTQPSDELVDSEEETDGAKDRGHLGDDKSAHVAVHGKMYLVESVVDPVETFVDPVESGVDPLETFVDQVESSSEFNSKGILEISEIVSGSKSVAVR